MDNATLTALQGTQRLQRPTDRPRTIVLGHNEAIHRALSQSFDVMHIVADSRDADTTWQDVHNLKLPLEPPSKAALSDGALSAVLRSYRQYVDMNSRRFVAIHGSDSEIYNGFVSTFYWAHSLLSKNVDLIVFPNIPHEGFDFVLYQLARHFGVRTIFTHQSIIPGYFWISEKMEEFGLFDRSPTLRPPRASNYELPKTWYYMATIPDNWSYGLRAFLLECVRRPWRLPPAAIRYYLNRQFLRNEPRTPPPARNESKPFVYVPLHLQPELTTSAMGGDEGRYADQAAVVETLSLLVPPNVELWVKENPKQTAQQRGPLFYRRLAALPNVRLIPRTHPSADLLQRCLGVATVTGTAGWEALFHGKPVLAFGNPWYRSFPGVTRFDSETTTFESWLRELPVSNGELVQLLDKLLSKAGFGVVDAEHAVVIPHFDNEENAQFVARSLSDYYRLTLPQ